MGTGYFKVHVSEEVLKSLDIRKYDIIIICITCYKTTGDTCYHGFDWYTCSHKCHTGCTGRCHGSRTVRLKCLGYRTDCIWEFLLRRKYCNKCFLSKCSVSNLTTSRATGYFCLTYRVCREIILMNISLCCNICIKSINLLYFR